MSINQPARVLGFFISGYLAERFGRKKSLICASVCQIVSAISVYFCTNYLTLMVAVSMSGLTLCMVTIPSYSLLSEICLIRFRSQLASLNTFHGNLGWLTGLCMGLVIPLKYYYVTLCFPSVIFLALCWKLPESPIWLMRAGHDTEARNTLTWLRGDQYNVEPELKEMEAVVSGEQDNSSKSVMDMVSDRTFLLPMFLTCALFSFQALCGCDIIAYYNGIIFEQAGIAPQYAAVIYQVYYIKTLKNFLTLFMHVIL